MSSYDPGREHRDFESEVERLRAQLQLTWEKEWRKLASWGVRDGMSIVDLGSGPGFMAANLLARLLNSQITCIEIDPMMVERSRQTLDQNLSRCRIIEASATATRLPAGSFDFALARFLLQHLPKPIGAVKEAFRLLKPGGKLVVIDLDQRVEGLSDPPTPKLQRLMAIYSRVHAGRGRKRSIGRQLCRLLRAAGFVEVDLDAVVGHSDLLGLQAFASQVDVDRLQPLAREGFVSREELEAARIERERFLGSPGSLIMTITLMVAGQKP